ncbi:MULTISPECIES: hypothetical protein [unclassified Nonomuraea]
MSEAPREARSTAAVNRTGRLLEREPSAAVSSHGLGVEGVI